MGDGGIKLCLLRESAHAMAGKRHGERCENVVTSAKTLRSGLCTAWPTRKRVPRDVSLVVPDQSSERKQNE
jgi:hypothetical protein